MFGPIKFYKANLDWSVSESGTKVGRSFGGLVIARDMKAISILFSALALCYAADPAANQKTEKETKKWLKEHFQDLSESDIKELGTSNKMVCALIKNKEKYVGEPLKHKARFIRALNFDCAVMIAEKNPDVLDELFTETNSAGRADFFTRLGLDKVCPVKAKFSKLDCKLTKALDEVCKDFKPAKVEEPTVTKKNAAAVVEASITAVFITSIVVIALA